MTLRTPVPAPFLSLHSSTVVTRTLKMSSKQERVRHYWLHILNRQLCAELVSAEQTESDGDELVDSRYDNFAIVEEADHSQL